jgi:uncharacterized phiE125 gp8 family phage protein
MRLILDTAPTDQAISLDLAKAHLRVDGAAEDDLIALYLASALKHIEDLAGLLLMRQAWVIERPDFPKSSNPMLVPLRPFIGVVSLTYADEAGADVVMDASDYMVDCAGERSFARISPSADGWPCVQNDRANAVRIKVSVGWEAVDKVPASLRNAALLALGAFYENRGDNTAALPPAIESLIAGFRPPGIA